MQAPSPHTRRLIVAITGATGAISAAVSMMAGTYLDVSTERDQAQALIEARTAAGLSQSQLARRMKTSQSYIARIEGGKVRPSTDALERFAQATRTRLRIIFEPPPAR